MGRLAGYEALPSLSFEPCCIQFNQFYIEMFGSNDDIINLLCSCFAGERGILGNSRSIHVAQNGKTYEVLLRFWVSSGFATGQ